MQHLDTTLAHHLYLKEELKFAYFPHLRVCVSPIFSKKVKIEIQKILFISQISPLYILWIFYQILTIKKAAVTKNFYECVIFAPRPVNLMSFL